MHTETCKYLVIDIESTTFQKGHPFSPRNKMCVVGLKNSERSWVFKVEYDDQPFGDALREIQSIIDAHDLLVLFNAKFDLHWLRRYGINFSSKRIHDCQLVEFVLHHQTTPYPALGACCDKRGLVRKLDVVYNDYWSKGIDTTGVPYEILVEYLCGDLDCTCELFVAQTKDLETQIKKRKLCNLENQDILVLQEMEWNGIKYDRVSSLAKAKEIRKEINDSVKTLNQLVNTHVVNWNSNEHISAVLYGGTIVSFQSVADGVFKTGLRKGETKYRKVPVENVFKRLITPLQGTQLAKEGYWSTGAEILASLKPKGLAKEIIDLLSIVTVKEKAAGTYYEGIPKIMDEMEWEDDIVHGQLNKCVTVTGRLSSSKPNLQNIPEEMDEMLISRF